MIDLHAHLLPGIDDGAQTAEIALEMARIAVAEGVIVQACTPHITPGVYPNEGPQIRAAVSALQSRLDSEGIGLRLTTGSDNHVAADFLAGLKSGRLLTLGDTRYVLVEPPHHLAPPRIQEFFFNLMVAGYLPILTHPERLTWIDRHYETIKRLAQGGVIMQITAGSIAGQFGRRPLYWAERMADEGLCHILASDAHGVERRRPGMVAGRAAVARRVGEDEAHRTVSTRPHQILQDLDLSALAIPSLATGGETYRTKYASKIGSRSAEESLGRRLEGHHKGSGNFGFAGWLRSVFRL